MPSPARRATLVRALLGAFAAALLATACSSVSLDEPIEGRVWWLAQLDGQSVAAGGEPQRDAQLQFEAAGSGGASGGRVSGSGGCNRLTANYQRTASALRIGSLGATRMVCADPGRSELETRFFAVLAATASYRLNGEQLLLLGREGQTLAVLGAAR